jgi:hypothetical protein
MKLKLLGMAILLTGIPLVSNAVVSAPAAHAVIGAYFCDVGGYPYCLNEWNDNRNTGQPIKMYQYGNSNEAYGFDEEYICNGGHVVTQTCPFPVGSGLNAAYAGSDIWQIAYGGNLSCLGTNTTSGQAVNQPCNDVNGNNGGPGTIFIATNCSGTGTGYYCQLISKYWSSQTRAAQWLCSVSKSNGALLYTDYNTGSCTSGQTYDWHQWY